jgi:hypothetical protein
MFFNLLRLTIDKNPWNKLLSTQLSRDVAAKGIILVSVLGETGSKEVSASITREVVEVVESVHVVSVVEHIE